MLSSDTVGKTTNLIGRAFSPTDIVIVFTDHAVGQISVENRA